MPSKPSKSSNPIRPSVREMEARLGASERCRDSQSRSSVFYRINPDTRNHGYNEAGSTSISRDLSSLSNVQKQLNTMTPSQMTSTKTDGDYAELHNSSFAPSITRENWSNSVPPTEPKADRYKFRSHKRSTIHHIHDEVEQRSRQR
jgi:hypothetical protein